MRQLKLSDLNLCNLVSAPTNIWQLSLKFARNFLSSCTINLQEFIDLQPDTKFSSLHLNYYEKQSNFLETVPILIRNAFEGNEVRIPSVVWFMPNIFNRKIIVLARRHWKMAVGETIFFNRHDLRATTTDDRREKRCYEWWWQSKVLWAIQSNYLCQVHWASISHEPEQWWRPETNQ